MIRTIDIRLNAAHPELPLPEATTYQGAPSTAFIRGVPKGCGQWQITAVNVAATFPDNSTTTRAAVLSAGDVWVCTIPACTTSGRVVSGLRILADGIDENGDAVTGYVLGVADFAVATFDIAPAPGETSYALRYFDSVPNPPHKGDVAKIGGVLKYYDGTAWQVFADVDLSNYATKADATLNLRGPNKDGFSAWTITRSYAEGEFENVTDEVEELPSFNEGGWIVEFCRIEGDTNDLEYIEADEDTTRLTWTTNSGENTYIATREALPGYQLGPDDGPNAGKPVASEAEAEALRTAVAAKYTKPLGGIPATDLASAVQTSLGKADTALQAHQQLADVYDEPIAAKWTYSGDGLPTGTTVSLVYSTEGGTPHFYVNVSPEAWYIDHPEFPAEITQATFTFSLVEDGEEYTVTATRVPVSYQLGSQETRKLATAAQGALAVTAVQPSALPASETWTFEVDDGQGGTTTVTKNVAVYVAGGNA